MKSFFSVYVLDLVCIRVTCVFCVLCNETMFVQCYWYYENLTFSTEYFICSRYYIAAFLYQILGTKYGIEGGWWRVIFVVARHTIVIQIRLEKFLLSLFLKGNSSKMTFLFKYIWKRIKITLINFYWHIFLSLIQNLHALKTTLKF